jgi:hypothetical protein
MPKTLGENRVPVPAVVLSCCTTNSRSAVTAEVTTQHAKAGPFRLSQRCHPRGSILIAAFCRLAKLLRRSEQMGWLVGAVGIEIASLTSKSIRGNGVAPPPHSNWSLLEPKCCPRRIPSSSFSRCGNQDQYGVSLAISSANRVALRIERRRKHSSCRCLNSSHCCAPRSVHSVFLSKEKLASD